MDLVILGAALVAGMVFIGRHRLHHAPVTTRSSILDQVFARSEHLEPYNPCHFTAAEVREELMPMPPLPLTRPGSIAAEIRKELMPMPPLPPTRPGSYAPPVGGSGLQLPPGTPASPAGPLAAPVADHG